MAFVIGLAFCPVPAVYQLGTIGLLSSHLSLRWLFKFLKTLKAELEILFRAK